MSVKIYVEIINKASRLKNDKIKQYIRFARDRGIKISKIVFKDTKSVFNGWFDPDTKCVSIAIGCYKFFPLLVIRRGDSQRKGYASDFLLRNKEEAIIYVTAHELRHFFQDQFPLAKRLGPNKNKYSESDADTFALRKLQAWRKKKRRLLARI